MTESAQNAEILIPQRTMSLRSESGLIKFLFRRSNHNAGRFLRPAFILELVCQDQVLMPYHFFRRPAGSLPSAVSPGLPGCTSTLSCDPPLMGERFIFRLLVNQRIETTTAARMRIGTRL